MKTTIMEKEMIQAMMKVMETVIRTTMEQIDKEHLAIPPKETIKESEERNPIWFEHLIEE